MANSAGTLAMSLSKERKGPPAGGVNGKKQKSRLENILFKLKKPDPEDESPHTLPSPLSPDPSSHANEEVSSHRESHPVIAGLRQGSENTNSSISINRRSSRKPVRREKGSQPVEQYDPDGFNEGNHLLQTDSSGDHVDEVSLQESCEEAKPDMETFQIKVEKEEEDWPGVLSKMPFSSELFSEQQAEEVPVTDTFSCDKCEDVFSSLHELDMHIDTHIKQETKDFSVYPCNVCGKSFASEAYLSRHTTTHDTEEADVDQGEQMDADNAFQLDGASKPTHKCDHCRRLFYSEDDFQQHKCRKGLVRPYGCGRCGRSYSHLSILKNHLSLHEKGLTSDLECYQCGQKFMYSIELRRHVTTVHIQTESTPPSVNVSPAKSSSTATTTSSSTSLSNDAQVGSDSKTSLKLKIPLSRFLPKKKLKIRSSGPPKIFTCQVCKKIFHKRSYMNMHMRVHGEKKFDCSYCAKKFTFKKSLEIHVRSHTGEKPYHCSFCTKNFTRQDSLHKHEKMHLGVKPFVCETCGRQYSDRFELQRHSLSHSQEKPHKCTLCSKAYNDKKRLKEHMFFHSGDLPYICELCGKGFARKYRYNQHLSQHAGEARFHCELCNKGFYRRPDLTSHMETHSSEKPYTCDTCGIGFLRESYLRRHQIVHSSDKPYPCNMCRKSFARKNTLQRHILTHKHKDESMGDEFGEISEHYGNYTADFGHGISGSVAPMSGTSAEERDIMKDIQAVIGLGDDVSVFE